MGIFEYINNSKVTDRERQGRSFMWGILREPCSTSHSLHVNPKCAGLLRLKNVGKEASEMA